MVLFSHTASRVSPQHRQSIRKKKKSIKQFRIGMRVLCMFGWLELYLTQNSIPLNMQQSPSDGNFENKEARDGTFYHYKLIWYRFNYRVKNRIGITSNAQKRQMQALLMSIYKTFFVYPVQYVVCTCVYK